jgi:hypothetical protein
MAKKTAFASLARACQRNGGQRKTFKRPSQATNPSEQSFAGSRRSIKQNARSWSTKTGEQVRSKKRKNNDLLERLLGCFQASWEEQT